MSVALSRDHEAATRIGDWLVEAEAGPLDPERAMEALPRQPELPAPAKLVLTAAGEPALMSEIPRDGDLRLALQQARAALDAAARWLERHPPDPSRQARDEGAVRRIEAALHAGRGWTWEETGAGRFRVTLGDFPGVRVGVVDLGYGGVRVTLPETPLRAGSPEVQRALGLFAIEASGRLRLVRLSVTAGPTDRVRAVREVLLPGRTHLDRWLPEAVEALVVAETETRRALRALTDAAVARAYLAKREISQDRRPERGRRKEAEGNVPVGIDRPNPGRMVP